MKNKDEELTEKLENMETDELLRLLVKKLGYDFSNEQIIDKRKANYSEIKEELYADYLEGFDEEFETHTKQRIKETPLLMSLFREFVQEIYRPSQIYKISLKTKAKINEELENTLDNDQRRLLKQWKFCEDRILDDMVEQAFIYGYSMSSQLREEAVRQYPYKKE